MKRTLATLTIIAAIIGTSSAAHAGPGDTVAESKEWLIANDYIDHRHTRDGRFVVEYKDHTKAYLPDSWWERATHDRYAGSTGLLLDRLPPCEQEDSRNCAWNAGTQGDGYGRSFVDLQGIAYYVPHSAV